MAIQSLLMIIGILAILLVIGVPISYSIGIASLVTILQTVPLDLSLIHIWGEVRAEALVDFTRVRMPE